MRRFCLCFLIITLIFAMCGCRFVPLPDFMATAELQQVQIDGITYRTGFYEGHHQTVDLRFVETCGTTDDGYEYAVLDAAPFDMIWTLEYGYYGVGALYCREDQYEEAVAYYADNDHYDYKLFEGNPADLTEDREYPMPNLEREKFEALMAFASEYVYDGALINVPLQDDDRFVGEYYLQKISKDGYIVENYGRRYRVYEGKLCMVWTYELAHGMVQAVQVPDALSDYFVRFLDIESSDT